MIARDVRKGDSKWGLFDPEECEDELACASRDHIEDMELRELNMMKLSSCVMALKVPETVYRETVLVFVRQTVRNQLLPFEHFFHAVQILDAAGIWTRIQTVQKQIVTRMAAVLVSVKLSDSMTRKHLSKVLASHSA